MTNNFLTEWRAEIIRLEKKGFIKALGEYMNSESPARKMATTADNDLLHGGAVFASKIAGHEGATNLVVSMAKATDEQFEPPDKFREEEIQ